MLGNVMTWVVTVVVALLAAWGGIQKGKADRERKRAEEAEAALSRSKVQQSIGQVADRIKDELIGRQRENAKAAKDIEQRLEQIAKEDPDEKARQQEKLVNDLNTGFNSRRRP